MDFAIYVDRRGWRRFSVAVYEIVERPGRPRTSQERYVAQDFVRCLLRRTARRYAERLADAYFLDQTKRDRLAIVFLPQPDEKIRIVGDDSPRGVS